MAREVRKGSQQVQFTNEITEINSPGKFTTKQQLEKLRDLNIYNRLKEGSAISESQQLVLNRQQLKMMDINKGMHQINKLLTDERSYIKNIKKSALNLTNQAQSTPWPMSESKE